MNSFSLPDPFVLVILLTFLSLLPFVAIMVTSFVKLVVVLSLVRNALGVQQIPPNMAINGLALILTLYIMSPVISSTYDTMKDQDFSNISVKQLEDIGAQAKAPFVQFLNKHTHKRELQFFQSTAQLIWPDKQEDQLNKDSLLVIIPAFTTSELTTAFQIGFLLYLPFVIIDIVISNILLAMGMMMVSPMTISLPFKLLLFVVIDGWARLIHGLVLTYL
jgi:type III secretion protein R